MDIGAYEYQEQLKQQLSQESRLNALPWNNAGPDAIALYKEFLAQNLEYSEPWFVLGIKLVGGAYWEQAFDSFQRCEQLHPTDKNEIFYFAALVWQGHIYDLRGQREQALEKYRAAQKVSNYASIRMRHDQWGIVLNSKWVEDRLKEPFTKKMIGK